MNPEIARPDWNGPHWTRRVLWIVAVLALGQAVGLAVWFWPGSMPDTNTSGVWIALADDAAHGDLYRPLSGPLGTGGTRYMPLFIGLHAALIKIGFEPLAAGMGLTLATVALLVVAMGALLRRLGAPRAVAWPAATVMLGTVSFGMMLLTVRGDFLAAALNLFGVASALGWREQGGRGRLWLAAACFAGAFLAKLTTVFGVAAVVGWMVWRGERRSAVSLMLTTGALMIVGVAVALWVSEGRMIASFLAVSSGGADGSFALRGPLRFLKECALDPLFCVLWVPAVIALVMKPGREFAAFPRWLVVATVAVTLIIFSSPGTHSNHLLDLEALAVLLIVLAFRCGGRWRAPGGVVLVVFGLGIAATWLPGVPSIPTFFRQQGVPSAEAPREFAAQIGPKVRPVFAENPLMPILIGERPYVADMFNLALMIRQDPALAEKVIGQLQRGEFGAVVVSNWPGVFPRDVHSPDDLLIAECWPELVRNNGLFPGFYEALGRYRIVSVRRPYIYFLRDDIPLPTHP